MQHFQISKGEAPLLDPPPVQLLPAETTDPTAAAWLGEDLPGLRPRFVVEVGARVATGQTLFVDRKCPEVVFVAPISGVVSEASYGPRRTLSICSVEADATANAEEEVQSVDSVADQDPRATLLSRGLWPAFRTRPFGRTPAPGSTPLAIVVNAVHSVPQLPDPKVVLADQSENFALGLRALTRLTGGIVYLCQSPGNPLGPATDRLVHASFAGTAAAGLAGTHIDRLCPVDVGGEVWSIGYQDVVAIGHLFDTGEYMAHRIVSISGPAVEDPRLLRTILGARLGDLGASEGIRAQSGDPRNGRDAAFLGRFDAQVSLVRHGRAGEPPARSRPRSARPGALIPTRALERALALDLLTVPILRALSVQDAEAARDLGCLALVEEDVAALSRRCTSGADYGALLRLALDDLVADAA